MTARILGIGAVTSLGSSLQQTLAALDDGEMGPSRDRKAIGIDGLPMTLAPVWPLHDIHDPLERLARLATLAVKDLAGQGFDVAQATRFSLCLPHGWKGRPRRSAPVQTGRALVGVPGQHRPFLRRPEQPSGLGLCRPETGSAQILIVAETYLVAELLDSTRPASRPPLPLCRRAMASPAHVLTRRRLPPVSRSSSSR
ncbi:hypothetical protein [Paracoccus sp. DMF]|uniref:hypothetical protein n=1 Tax=Paracoccus sp. DMF TaxID=400837 RepID=UPI0021E46A17|nr:hypothetical protein [Paracoccus sp. DMF]